ncbi:uncharacterized protein si:ch211-199g17.2 isoform X2 [Platichthys flesus]|uniref:uncharacterized protein si:ch211-199g17.2 isoform X2 n=1 Tax=Platichthys flesus TaxID=8260 RepID=UPI002DBCE249|nr:uncharacterized protein si:ch211-199g17.2 isoform X2 [Platichthys flesus]
MESGLSSTGELFDSLKVYLNNKKRLQPIIGLGSIIECVKVGERCREASYLCEVCVCRLSKADMRNHISGSLHRYNYIKAWHPHLVCEWKENSDLSRLAWPLMEIARTIEAKEGSGDVKVCSVYDLLRLSLFLFANTCVWMSSHMFLLLDMKLIEVGDVLYQKVATLSENDAVTLIAAVKTVRDWQGGPECLSQATSDQLEQNSGQSQRTVLLGRHQPPKSERSLDADVISHKMSTQTNNLYPTVESEGWLTNSSTPHSNNTEPSVLSENSSSFLHGYRGTKPLIGLGRVVECRIDTGCTFLFLCHCCRIRTNKTDIIDHLTGSSHLINYLMETNPEQVEASTADINDNFLRSLAEKVEQEEGRGELKVIDAPESLCIQLTGRSYHWCLRMLCNRWTTSTPNNKLTVRGHSVNKVSVEGVTEKRSAVLSNWGKRTKTKKKKKKKGKVADTLFTVSLPLTKGPVVLQRTSFSKDILPVSCSPPPASDLFPSPKSDTDNGDAESFAVDHDQHTLYTGGAVTGQYMAGETNCTVTLYQMMDGYSSDNEHLGQSNDTTEREDQKGYWERSHDRHHGSQERSRENIPCTPEMGYDEQWYHQQLLQNPHMAPDHISLMAADAGRSGRVAPRSDAAWINTCPQLGDVLAYSGSFAPETSVRSHGTDQRQVPTYLEFTSGNVQITPQSYMTPPLAYHGVQTGQGAMSNPSYSYGQTTEPDCYSPYQDSSSSSSCGWDMSCSNAFIPPVPSLYYGTSSDSDFRGTGRLRVDDFQGWR